MKQRNPAVQLARCAISISQRGANLKGCTTGYRSKVDTSEVLPDLVDTAATQIVSQVGVFASFSEVFCSDLRRHLFGCGCFGGIRWQRMLWRNPLRAGKSAAAQIPDLRPSGVVCTPPKPSMRAVAWVAYAARSRRAHCRQGRGFLVARGLVLQALLQTERYFGGPVQPASWLRLLSRVEADGRLPSNRRLPWS